MTAARRAAWPGIPGGAVLCAVIALGSGWYDYRVWTYRSRRLIV